MHRSVAKIDISTGILLTQLINEGENESRLGMATVGEINLYTAISHHAESLSPLKPHPKMIQAAP